MAKSIERFARAFRDWLRHVGRSADTGPTISPVEWFAHEANTQMIMKRREIDTAIVDEATARRFMDRVIAQWQALGEVDPYWSNDTQDQFRQDVLTDATIETFYQEGSGVMDVIRAFESRCGVEIGAGVCMELGCGVGKHTHVLAQRFKHVIGLDVSQAGLTVCAEHMKRFGLANVTTMHLKAPDALAACGPIDFFMSLSVLQHNPPPVQKLLLQRAFTAIRPGGFALFQVPDYLNGYHFSTEQFLNVGEALFDIHCLPKVDVLETLELGGMKLLDFAPDATLGNFGSYTFFATKRVLG